MTPEQDDAVLPEAGGDLSSSSQDDEEEDDVVDEDDEDVDDDDDVINSASPSSTSNSALPVAIAAAAAAAPPAVTVALPAPPLTSAAAAAAVVPEGLLDPKWPRTIKYDPVLLPAPKEKKPVAVVDERRLFQRLWTDEDEIELLQGFLDYTTQRGNKGGGGGGSHQNDTALFYDQIKSKLQLEFNKNQLVEKLRRLKKKYRNVLNKISNGKEVSFKSPHDQATFEISRKIWSNIGGVGAGGADDNALDDEDPNPNNPNFNHFEVKTEDAPAGFQKSAPRSRKRQRPPAQPKMPSLAEPAAVPVIKENHHNVNNGGVGVGGGSNCGNCNVQGMIEETVKSCMSPLFRELMSNSMGGGQTRGFGGLSLNPIPLSFGGPSINLNFGGGEAADEQWRKQQILELEVYSKRLELVQNQIKVALDELRSTGGG